PPPAGKALPAAAAPGGEAQEMAPVSRGPQSTSMPEGSSPYPRGGGVPPWRKRRRLAILAQVGMAGRRMTVTTREPRVGRDVERLAAGRHHDPGVILGLHADGTRVTARSLLPGAARAAIADTGAVMQRMDGTDLFEWTGPAGSVPPRFRVTWWRGTGG